MMRKMELGEKDIIKDYVNYRRRKRHLKHLLCLIVPIMLLYSTVFVFSFAEIEITASGELLLFKTNTPGLEEDLNAGVVSEELKNIFETEGFPLSENAAIIDGSDTEYVIANEEKSVISTEAKEIVENRSSQLSENGTSNNKTENEYIIKNEEKDVVAEESKKIVTTKSYSQSEKYTASRETYKGYIVNEGKIYTIQNEDGTLKVYGKMISLRYIIATFIIIYVLILSSKLLYVPLNYKLTNMEIDKRIAFDKVKESIIIATLTSVIIYMIEILVVRILPTLHGYNLLFPL